MKYGEEEFFRLLAEVQNQSGTHLDETHDNVYHTQFTGKKTTEGVAPRGEISYCRSNALFDVTYLDFEGHQDPVTGLPTDGYVPKLSDTESIKVCAVDDGIGLWPRFAEAEAPGFDHFYLPGKFS